jgi:hypothetical protein
MENSHKSFNYKIKGKVTSKSLKVTTISTNNSRKIPLYFLFPQQKNTDFSTANWLRLSLELSRAYHRISCSSGEHNTRFFITIFFLKPGRIEKSFS